MLRLIIALVFLLNINSYAQTNSYLKDVTAPGSIEDIVKLLNLKNVKRVTIFSQEKNKRIFIGEIILNKDGKCIKKHSCQGNITYHTYDNDGNLIEKVSSGPNSTNFRHIEYKYNDNGDLIETISKDKSGAIIYRDSLMLSITIVPSIPRYRDTGQNSNTGDIEKYTYNSAGLLIKYFSEGFYRPSSKSRKDAEFKRNKIEYRYEYSSENQITKYYKKLTLRSSVCEVITEFNYINNSVIEVKSNSSIGCRCFICYEKLLYKIEYY